MAKATLKDLEELNENVEQLSSSFDALESQIAEFIDSSDTGYSRDQNDDELVGAEEDAQETVALTPESIPVCANEGGVTVTAPEDPLQSYQLNVDVYDSAQLKVGHCELIDNKSGLLTISTCNTEA